MRYSETIICATALFTMTNAEEIKPLALAEDLNCGYFDFDCWQRQLQIDFEESALDAYNSSQCAYYFVEGKEGDYYSGVDWNATYDIEDTNPGTGCAVWYDYEARINWEEFRHHVASQLSYEHVAEQIQLSAKLPEETASKDSSNYDVMMYIACALGSVFVVAHKVYTQIQMQQRKPVSNTHERFLDEFVRV